MEGHGETERLLFRITYILKRLTDRWAAEHLPSMTTVKFNVTFLPYFMNIGTEGISNTELVSIIKVTKQAVSKTVRELEELGLVYTVKGESDARSIMIYLTEEGKTLYHGIKLNSDKLSEEYVELVGPKKYDAMIDGLLKIIDFHEQMEKS